MRSTLCSYMRRVGAQRSTAQKIKRCRKQHSAHSSGADHKRPRAVCSQLPEEFAARVAHASERNLRRALLMMESSKVQAGPGGIKPEQQVARADWQMFISQLAVDILQEQSPGRCALRGTA
jgi:hypothetical protein